jgi:hypothetical protein
MTRETEAVFIAICVFIIVLVCLGVGQISGENAGRKDTLREAFDKGFAVECTGIEGYYWDCPER